MGEGRPSIGNSTSQLPTHPHTRVRTPRNEQWGWSGRVFGEQSTRIYLRNNQRDLSPLQPPLIILLRAYHCRLISGVAVWILRTDCCRRSELGGRGWVKGP